MKITKIILFLNLLILLSTTSIYSRKLISSKITSEPSGAIVKINDDPNAYTTPFQGNFYENEEYKLTFTKEGYKKKTVNYIGGNGNLNVVLVKENSDSNSNIIRSNIDSNPSNAVVTISGDSNSYFTPVDMNFREGKSYTLTFSKDGYESKTISYTGGSGDIFVKLQKKNIQEEEKINIDSDPSGANFKISGDSNTYTTPRAKKFITDKTYQLTFWMDGYESKTISYTGGSGDIFVKLQKSGPSESKISIDSDPSGAYFKVSGDSNTYTTPRARKFIVDKTYQITFWMDGYESKTISYTGGEGDIFVKLKGNKFSLKIDSNVSNAKVFINGDESGNTPVILKLNPGTYTIKVKAPGYRGYSTEINLDRDKTVYANLEQDQFIKVKLPKGAKLSINGEKQNLDWDSDEDYEWKVFTFYGPNDINEVEVKYHGVVIKKQIKFDGRSIALVFDLM